MPLSTVPKKGETFARPPARTTEKVRTKYGGTHVSHTWQSKTKAKRKWVSQYVSKSGKVVKGH
jgi:hypothetical protein